MTLYARHETARLLNGTPLPLVGRRAMGGPDATVGEVAKLPRFILSTAGEATDNHIIRQEFWDTSRATGVGIPCLVNHEHRNFIGQWQDFALVRGNLEGSVRFDSVDPEALRWAGFVERDMIRAVSAGWIPGEMVRRSSLKETDPFYRAAEEDECGQPAEGFVMGSRAKPNVLCEVSLVPVPADDGAQVVSRLHERAAKVAGGDIDALLAVLGDDPRVRRRIEDLVRAVILTERQQKPAARTVADLFGGVDG
jgi:phage head maturation protease